MLRGAIFDFDGTLFDSMFVWDRAGEAYLRSLGIEPKEELQKVLKPMSLLQSALHLRDTHAIPLSVEAIMDGIPAAGARRNRGTASCAAIPNDAQARKEHL